MKAIGTKGPAPTPIQTDLRGKRWRWDTFATMEGARRWFEIREAEGHRVYLRRTAVAWDQTIAPKRFQYPKTKVDHCAHCGERQTFARVGTGRRYPGTRTGRREYEYQEIEPRHACVGLLQARKHQSENLKRLNRMMARVLIGGGR